MIKNKKYIIILALFIFIACKIDKKVKVDFLNPTEVVSAEPQSDLLKDRVATPKNFSRTDLPENSFGSFLRNLKLKPEGTLVKYYNGEIKKNYDVYVGVVDLPIGDRDLHQCADAVMRLRAEYLWYEKQYDKIHFNFTNGHRVEYSEWMKGKRMKVDGNITKWVDSSSPSSSYESFWDYLELIFMYAGTASLEKEMKTIDSTMAQVGDVLIQGGFPGHAVIIVDEVTHHETGEKLFLLAQSYMPAQEIQILTNPDNISLSPWYSFDENEIKTPEWTFYKSDFKRF